MALRYQKEDEVDRAAKEGRRLQIFVPVVTFFAVWCVLSDWLQGYSLKAIEKDLGEMAAGAVLIWFCLPLYREFRYRTKEIDGKVSAIEKAIITSKEDHNELLEKLNAIEGKLANFSDRLQGLRAADDVTYSTIGMREGLRTTDARSGRTKSPK